MDKGVKLLGILPFAIIAVTTLTTAGGCGKGEGKKASTQVAAKVNGDEISVHQINMVLSRAQGVTAENADDAKKQILDKLIDQQLAIQQAEAAKLDRNPNVMQAIEAARREIIARAYLEQVANAQPKPTGDEIKKYFADHPELFAQRRVYNLQELLIERGAPDEIKQLVAQNKSMQELANALKAHNVKFAANAGVRSADQLPLPAAAKLHTVKDGQTALIEGPQGLMVAHILASQVQPISEEQATTLIQKFLTNQHAGEAVTKELKSLREKAKIEHVMDLAAAPAGQAAKAAEAPKAETTGGIDAKSIAKGIAGLK